AIVEGERVRIAIEVDGWDKAGRGQGMNKREMDDYLLRQNALSQQGWTVLRFLNSRVERDPRSCIQEIERTVLLARQQALDVADSKQRRASPRSPALVVALALLFGASAGAGAYWISNEDSS